MSDSVVAAICSAAITSIAVIIAAFIGRKNTVVSLDVEKSKSAQDTSDSPQELGTPYSDSDLAAFEELLERRDQKDLKFAFRCITLSMGVGIVISLYGQTHLSMNPAMYGSLIGIGFSIPAVSFLELKRWYHGRKDDRRLIKRPRLPHEDTGR
ncbi:MAG: hypothetical protein WBD31_24600 [Rubripirellula sp.]